MTNLKPKNNWIYLLIGIGILIWTLITFDKSNSEYFELRSIKVQLRQDIEKVTGARKKADYKFYANSYKAMFQILVGGISSDNRKYISNLKKGQIIEIKINQSAINNLNLKEKINVYGIDYESRSLLTTNECVNNRKTYKNRINILFMVFGLMSILKGLNISNKIRLIAFFGSIAIFVILRILNIGY